MTKLARLSDAELVERLKLLHKYKGVQAQAARALGIGASAFKASVQESKRRGLTAKSRTVDTEARLRTKLKLAERELAAVHRENDTAESIRKEIYQLAANTPDPPRWLNSKRHKVGDPGVPIVVWSDWHWGERVDPVQVGGVNRYDRVVAKRRLQRLIDTTIDLATRHMVKPKYPGIVVCMGGDMITGAIHEELGETNDGYVQQHLLEVQEQLISALEKMADTFGKVFVPCVVGNHGRNTVKPRCKGRVYCLDADTPILTRDLRWVRGGDLSVGTPLLAFDEEAADKRGRRYKNAVVMSAGTKRARTIKITLEDGTTFYATPEHKFLAHGQKGQGACKWITAQEMLAWSKSSRKNKGTWRVDRFLTPWKEDLSYEAGYLAAAFDGEGCLARSKPRGVDGELFCYQLSYNQTDNAMLREARRCLQVLGFDWYESVSKHETNKTKYALYITGGFDEIARFLGTVRPKRLLEKWAEFDVGAKFLHRKKSVHIVSAEDGGEREIAMLSSSSETYFSDGFASHNTNYEWNLYCQLERHFLRDKRIQFMIPGETDAHFTVAGHRYMLTHGDMLGVRGGDGIIGALGPVARGAIKVGRSEAQIGRDFDTMIMCHYHTYIPRSEACAVIVNGSMKGYDEYVRLQLRVPYSRPSQALWFTHPKHGITAQWQIYLEDAIKVESRKSDWVTWQARTRYEDRIAA